ncbi:hypothetical protein GCM10011490_12670 [Pseudoclavibacter endophyticus]|uniref:Alanine racemase n=1 Tax=Pseudoclavibacter endophyticus TaxID=1778590 RepID=A0A6H9WJF7_9MICO|nr:alanine racemase [Pseudoclavibacter endophyticus]KAB1649323.1 hypothetical protein F8O04_03355 [Pseudoclavibacter endophyticus]GGA63504.1 hypothetical protein GCM10011490_12670 [Pseudoclavibacter endophyticus]
MTVPRIEVDLAAVRHNVATVKRTVATPIMAVVKAGGYGHGALAVARAALDGGAEALGVADIAEALSLRNAGIDAPMLAWLHGPSTDWLAAIEADVDVAVSSIEQLQLFAAVAERAGRPARVQVKLDTGLGRNGANERDWGAILAHVRELEIAGVARFAGLFSHLSGASRDADLRQVEAFERARAIARAQGVEPERYHLGATAGGLDLPEARYDLVRLGISMYGLTPHAPDTPSGLGLRPGLRLVAPLARDAAGWFVEVGAADGLPPLDAGAAAPLRLEGGDGRSWRLLSVGDVTTRVEPVPGADAEIAPAGSITLFGAPDASRRTTSADEWALAAGTIGYEIVTRLSPRLERRDAATGGTLETAPCEPRRTTRGLVAPRRTLTIDAVQLRASIAELADAGVRTLDVSADAYGIGLETIAAIAADEGVDLVVRTAADAERAAAGGHAVRHDPDAPDVARAAYGFRGGASGCLRLTSELVHVKWVEPGTGVSYGHEFVTAAPTALGLVPIGYADALPRRVAGAASVRVIGEAPFRRGQLSPSDRVPIVGRVAMDQVVVDLGDTEAWVGSPVVVFGTDAADPPLAEVAAWAGVSPAAFVAAIGPRVERVVIGGTP